MEIYRRLNTIAQEIEDRERAILIEPNNPLKQYQLGLVYAKYGKIDKAISAFRAALALDANAHYALNALARLYILQGGQVAGCYHTRRKSVSSHTITTIYADTRFGLFSSRQA